MARVLESKKSNLVGARIRQLRIEHGLSQKALAEQLELKAVYVCRGSISRVEDYQRTVTDIELKAFSEIFGVTVDDLYD